MQLQAEQKDHDRKEHTKTRIPSHGSLHRVQGACKTRAAVAAIL